MPIATAVMVGPADLLVRKSAGLLTCLGLRTGACLCLYDPEVQVAGMAHITDCEATERHPNRPGKYACSGVEALIEAMERTGAFRNRLIAVLVGGAEVSVRDGDEGSEPLVIDAGVCRAVELELNRNAISILAKELGGKADRSVTFDVANGNVRVKWPHSNRSRVCDLSTQPSQALVA
jgi:chemotaxis protein CheD